MAVGVAGRGVMHQGITATVTVYAVVVVVVLLLRALRVLLLVRVLEQHDGGGEGWAQAGRAIIVPAPAEGPVVLTTVVPAPHLSHGDTSRNKMGGWVRSLRTRRCRNAPRERLTTAGDHQCW